MKNQTDIGSDFPVTVQCEPYMTDDGVCAAFCKKVDGLIEIYKPGYGSRSDSVIHRHYDCRSRISLHDSFKSYLFSSHF